MTGIINDDELFDTSEHCSREEAAKKVKEELTKLERCAYESLDNNKEGKYLQKWMRDRLFFTVGSDLNASYVTGQHDMLRMVLGFISSYKIKKRIGL